MSGAPGRMMSVIVLATLILQHTRTYLKLADTYWLILPFAKMN